MADETGIKIFVGPSARLEVGEVTTGPAAVRLETVNDNLQRVFFTIPAPSEELVDAANTAALAAQNVVTRADAGEFKGAKGDAGPIASVTIGTVTTTTDGTATAGLSGSVGQQKLNLGLPRGATGQSAYQAAQAAGYTGTEAQWLASMGSGGGGSTSVRPSTADPDTLVFTTSATGAVVVSPTDADAIKITT